MAGSIILSLAFVLSLFSMVTYFRAFKGSTSLVNYARLAYHGMAMLVIIASTVLLYLILTHQYEYKYIYSYSNGDLSTGFLISTFWAGQEGSFLLWLLLTCIVGIVLQSYTAKRGELEFAVMSVFTLSTTFLLAMVSPLLKNPFELIWATPNFIDIKHLNQSLLNNPVMQNFLFSDPNTGQNFFKFDSESYSKLQAAGIAVSEIIVRGKGLNPLLQNFWMQIHPPILFAGFAMTSVPFAFAIASLMLNDYKNWVRQTFPWILAGSGILGLGIMLGGYWAYGVLGWGGYWAWDPVENSSLVPWLVSTAAIHTMLVQRKGQAKGDSIGKFVKTNLILSILGYVLVIYSTFLTRSGILGDSSVHSFVDPGMAVYAFLLVFIISFTLLGIGMIVYRWKHLNEMLQAEESLLSRELALFTGTVALAASALIVFVGTSAPLFKQTVETSFYNEMHVPLGIIVGLLNALSLTLRWKNSNVNEVWQKSRISILLTVLSTLAVVFGGGVYKPMMILLVFSSALAFYVNTEIAIKVIKGKVSMLGAYLAHIGIALFILGVVGSSGYSIEKTIDLPKGKVANVFGYDLTFTGYHPIENNTKYAFNIDVSSNGSKYQVKPVMYISDFNNGLMREPDILTGLFKDIYVSPLGYDDGTQQKPQAGSEVNINLNEETRLFNAKIKYAEFIKPDMAVMQSGGDFTMGAKITVDDGKKSVTQDIVMEKHANDVHFPPVDYPELNLRINLVKIDPISKNAVLNITQITSTVQEATIQPKEILSITASVKPFVNLVWLGVAVLVLGFFVSAARRLKETLNS